MNIRAFEDATQHLCSIPTLREMVERDGFVYFRKLVPEQAILNLRVIVLEFAAKNGWLDNKAAEDDVAMLGRRIGAFQDDDWVQLQVHVQGKKEMRAVGDHSSIRNALGAIIGGSSYPHLTTANICRVVSPHPDMATKPHQDANYLRMFKNFWIVWLPLGDCPREYGPLALLSGSHRDGLQEHTGTGSDGGVQVAEEMEWTTGDFACGDAVMFHPLTLHCSLPNQSGTRLRLSVDFRYEFRLED